MSGKGSKRERPDRRSVRRSQETLMRARESTIEGGVLRPALRASITVCNFSPFGGEGTQLNLLADELELQCQAIRSGSHAHIDEMLVSQAHVLDAVFNALASCASRHLGLSVEDAERYTRLALKAQKQCRETVEALRGNRSLKTIFATQANVSAGNQQVNNS